MHIDGLELAHPVRADRARMARATADAVVALPISIDRIYCKSRAIGCSGALADDTHPHGIRSRFARARPDADAASG